MFGPSDDEIEKHRQQFDMCLKCLPLKNYRLRTKDGDVYYDGVNIKGFPVFVIDKKGEKESFHVSYNGKWSWYRSLSMIKNFDLHADKDSILCPSAVHPLIRKYNNLINVEMKQIDPQLSQFKKRVWFLLRTFSGLLPEVAILHIIRFLKGVDLVKIIQEF